MRLLFAPGGQLCVLLCSILDLLIFYFISFYFLLFCYYDIKLPRTPADAQCGLHELLRSSVRV